MKSPFHAIAGGFALGLALAAPAIAAPSDDLLGYWALDNNTNDTATGGVSNDNGSWVGGSGYTSSAPFGSAATMNGNRHINCGTSADLEHAGGSITISAWFDVTSFNKGWQCLLGKGEGSNFRIARQSSNDAISYAGGTGDIFGGNVNDGDWHHVVAISEAGNNMFLYLDGDLIATGGAPSLTDTGLPLTIGENPEATNRQWNGHIDDVALFGTALNDFQAKAIHHFGTIHGYPMSDVIQIFDAHDDGAGGSVVIGGDTWNYEASDTGSGDFVLLGPDGSGVDFASGPTITSFQNAPIFINSGQNATLSWQVTAPYTALSINQGVGNVLPQTNGSGAGSISVSPTSSTTYTLSATNAIGTTTRSTTVFVDVDPSTPRINEFVADNSATGLLDEDGESEDWIEIYNPGPNAADLSTFYLTDSALALNKWAFPAVTMQPDTYLVVFASSKGRAVAGSELHTNFKLSAGGEYLALTKDDGGGGFDVANEYSPTYPSQEEGFSYGIDPDGITLGYLETPTPGAANGQTSMGFVADTMFDIDRGFFTAPFTLNITTLTPGATIRYTTDGSEPTATTGSVYGGPLTISSTTTLRAAAFKTGFFPTNVDTHTYFFLSDVRTQYANGAAPSGWPSGSENGQEFNYGMDPDITNQHTAQEMIDALSAIPSVSITTTQDNLTHPSTGIYTNPGSHGKSWERPASFEIVHPDGTTPNVQSNCGIRIRGGFSRSKSNPKHALRIFFRSEYGAGKLDYPLFGADGVDKFDKVDLRTSQNYSWAFQNNGSNTFLREVLGRDLQRSFGQPHTRSRYYHLYLNGVYWGLYMTQERAEANHGESYLGGDDANYDTIKSAGSSGSYNTEATDGSFAPGSDWHTLWTMARQQNGAQGGGGPTMARFMEMQGLNPDGSRNPALPVYLDVDNLIDYQMIIGYTGNYDAPLSNFVGASNNWYSVRDRVRDEHGFQFFVHDGEHTMGAGGGWSANDRMNTGNGGGSRDTYNKSNPSFVHFDLEESTEEYRLRFADRAHGALFNDGLLTTASVTAHMEARRQTVADVIIAESARWGDSKRSNPFDEGDWVNAVNSLQGIINSRSNTFLGHLRTANLYPDLNAPSYTQHGGMVASGSTVTALAPTAGTHLYYMIGTGDSDDTDWQDDLDPRLLGGAINPSASVLAISGGGGGPTTTHYIQEGDDWAYLDNGSNQGTAWRASGFNDNSWAVGASELGYGDGDEATIVSDGPGAPNRPATTYFRKTVTIPNPSTFGDFEIAVTYDDAYAIYVNGNEVARSPTLAANAAYDTYATGTVGNNAIDNLSIPTSDFSAGSNTIAVEIHQSSGGSSDISFNMRLTGRPPGGGNTVALPIPQAVTSPVWIKSRAYNSNTGEWSAMNQAFFTTAPDATPADIVISEVHYHPLDPTVAELGIDPTFNQDDFEFVEVMNIGADTVDLGGAAFVLLPVGDHLEGIEYTFPLGTLIAPDERLVVVANSSAFAARYPGVTITGDYSNRLDNTGEWITLVDSAGNVIDSFRYNDLSPWPEAADGDGNSLVLNNPTSAPDPALPGSWGASAAIGGSPGATDGNAFVGDPLADVDRDGGVAIVEYLQGLSDTVPSADQFPSISVVDIDGDIYPLFTFRLDPLATSATPVIEGSETLETWFNLEDESLITLHSSTTDTDEIPLLTYRFIAPVTQLPRLYLRLTASY